MTAENMERSIHFQQRDPGTLWRKDPDVAIDSDGSLDAVRTLTPNVVKMAGGYRMYYHGFGPERPNADSKGYILSAFSTDAEHWDKEPGVRMDAGGVGAEHYIWSPDVIPLEDGRYRMYYEGKTEHGEDGVKAAIVSSISDDGLVWEREPGLRLAAESVSYLAPRCLHLGTGEVDARFRLYASSYPYPGVPSPGGGFDDRNIVSALSADGLRFTQEPGVRIPQDRDLESYAVYAPEVLRLGDGGYRMYYAGWQPAPDVPSGSKCHGRIFSAFSRDGTQWVKDPEVCIDNGGRWDTAKASEPCVIDLPDGRFRMFYEACDLEGRWRIASATAVR